jgi:hypothetical protein
MQWQSSHSTPADDRAEDDIDKVFKQLLPLEPSSELISHILAHIRQVVRPMPTTSEPPDCEG